MIGASGLGLAAFACVGGFGSSSEPSPDGVDATAADGAPGQGDGDLVPDAPLDAATGGTFCASVDADFCEDFDGLKSRFDPPGAGPVTIIDNKASFKSAPKSLQFVVPSLDGGFAGGLARGLLNVAGRSFTAVRLELDWEIESDSSALASANSLLDVVILQPDGVGGVAIHHQVASDGGPFYSVGPALLAATLEPVVGAIWHHVVLTVHFAPPAAGRFSLVVDGDTWAETTDGLALPVPTSTLGVLIGGQSAAAKTPAMRMSFDNVVLTLLP